jgi:hypothetical protein
MIYKMSNITKFPTSRVFPRRITAKEIYAQPKPSSEMIWDICPYLRICDPTLADPRCNHCPEWELINNEKYKKRCYALAEEACRVIFAAQKR